MTDDERVIERARVVSRELDDYSSRLLRAIHREDADAARRLLAGPVAVAVRGTLDRLDSQSEEGGAA